MFDFKTDTFSSKEQIVVRLKEYDTLRAEIATRTAGIYQAVGISATVAIFLFTWWSSSTLNFGLSFWVAVGLFALTSIVFALSTRRDINKIARRIADIEAEVNRLSGATLLEWESRFGAASTGWFRRKAT